MKHNIFVLLVMFLCSRVFASTTTPNMGLTVPTVGVTSGVDAANQINSSLNLIDAHDHSSGKGVQVNQNGLNIQPGGTAQDGLNNNDSNLYNIRGSRFTSQSSALGLGTDINTVYVANGDLYYNNSTGTQVRITAGGSVTGSTGTITGLPSGTAGANFSAGTFTFTRATNTGANIDAASYILRNNSVASNGLTLSPPNSLASNYTITLPTLPASQSFLTIDASGNMSAPTVYPLTSSGIATAGVATANIADAAVTKVKQAAVGQATASAVGFNNISSSNHTINSVSFTNTAGHPTVILIAGAASGTPPYVQFNSTGGNDPTIRVTTPNGDDLPVILITNPGVTGTNSQSPAGGMIIDTGATAGTGTYTLYINTASNQCQGDGFGMIAYEL